MPSPIPWRSPDLPSHSFSPISPLQLLTLGKITWLGPMHFRARVADAISGNFAGIFIATISLLSPIDARASPIWAATNRGDSFDSRDRPFHARKAPRRAC